MNTLGFLIYATFVVIGCVGDLFFLIGYTIKSRPKWWRSDVGRHIFAFSALFGVLYIRTLIRLFDSRARTAVMSQSMGDVVFGFTVVILAAFIVWQRVWIFMEWPKPHLKKKGGKGN